MIDFILRQAKQPSTWRGIIMVIGLIGYKVSPELQETIITAVGGAIALIEVIRNEMKPATPEAVAEVVNGKTSAKIVEPVEPAAAGTDLFKG